MIIREVSLGRLKVTHWLQRAEHLTHRVCTETSVSTDPLKAHRIA